MLNVFYRLWSGDLLSQGRYNLFYDSTFFYSDRSSNSLTDSSRKAAKAQRKAVGKNDESKEVRRIYRDEGDEGDRTEMLNTQGF